MTATELSEQEELREAAISLAHELETYRDALFATGCHDLFCAEYARNCHQCNISRQAAKHRTAHRLAINTLPPVNDMCEWERLTPDGVAWETSCDVGFVVEGNPLDVGTTCSCGRQIKLKGDFP